MKCQSCNSDNLKIYSKYVLWVKEDGVWFNATPFELPTQRDRFILSCNDCQAKFNYCIISGNVSSGDNLIITDKIEPIERSIPDRIKLDLDHTLISSFIFDDETMKGDFSIEVGSINYEVLIRPNLKVFIDFCLKNFSSVEVITAGTKEYAKEICKKIGLDNVKLTTREDLVLAELDMRFGEMDYIKDASESLMIDDKTYIFSGKGFLVLNPKPYISSKTDDELLKIIEYILKNKN